MATILKQKLIVKIVGYGQFERPIFNIEGAPVELIDPVPTNSIAALWKWLWPDLEARQIRLFCFLFVPILSWGVFSLFSGLNYNKNIEFYLLTPLILIVFFLLFGSISRSVNLDYFRRFVGKLGFEPLVYSLISKKMAKLALMESPDIIHAHDFIGLLAAVRAKRHNQEIKIIWDAHELYTEQSYRNKITAKYMFWYLKRNSKCLDFFITINDSIADFYRSNFPSLPDPIIIKNAARTAQIGGADVGLLRRAANIDKNQKILLFQGGLAEDRGIPELVQASKSMPSDWSIVFMGEGTLSSFLIDQRRRLNFDRPERKPRIALVPPAPYSDLANWTSGATLGAIPYRNTSLNHYFCTPNKLWEYPFAGVPILASGLKEMKNFIEKHRIGRVMPIEYTAMDISEALTTFSQSEYRKLQANCKKLQKNENWSSKYAPRLIAIYEDIQNENSNIRRR